MAERYCLKELLSGDVVLNTDMLPMYPAEGAWSWRYCCHSFNTSWVSTWIQIQIQKLKGMEMLWEIGSVEIHS